MSDFVCFRSTPLYFTFNRRLYWSCTCGRCRRSGHTPPCRTRTASKPQIILSWLWFLFLPIHFYCFICTHRFRTTRSHCKRELLLASLLNYAFMHITLTPSRFTSTLIYPIHYLRDLCVIILLLAFTLLSSRQYT